jgi:leader peptidase (prepilin peptidase) / N-methyltransferase
MWQIRSVIPPLAIDIFVFCFGLVIGSFLNVCIVRIPEHKSIVLPSSACPKCGAKIRPYDNIPVLSWVLLRGKCRDCRTPISPMYPLVELVTGVLFWGCYTAFGLSVNALKWAAFSAIVIVLVFTDLRERILPDVVNFTGFGIGLALSLVVKPADGTAAWLASHLFDFPLPVPVLSLADSLFGAAIGAGLLWAVSKLYFRLRGREGMGMGDVKMMLMVGAFFGIKRTLLTIFAGSLLGSILGIAFILSRRKDSTYELPFGTFLGMAALLVAFFGTPVVNWYQTLMTGR